MKILAVVGWTLLGVTLYGLHGILQRHEQELAKLEDENVVLWEQVARFNDAWAETRARQAVTN